MSLDALHSQSTSHLYNFNSLYEKEWEDISDSDNAEDEVKNDEEPEKNEPETQNSKPEGFY